MHLLSLRLRHFRNYGEELFSLSPGANLFIGDNAQGKTNLLEAVYLLITGRSFRTRTLPDLIQQGEETLFVEAHFEKHTLSQSLTFALSKTEKRLLHNGTPLTSPLGLLRGVLLSPEDRALITGSPALRRRYLDLQLAQIDPLYVRALSRYTRALKHRNQLLRSHCHATLDTWEAYLAKEAATLTAIRSRAVPLLAAPFQENHTLLTGGDDRVTLTYQPTLTSDPRENALAYAKARPRELLMGHTLIGPHRDDLLITIAGKEARHFGSEGQKMSCTASLKLAEWDHLNSRSEEKPLLLVDDIGLGLDRQRKGRLLDLIEERGQLLITSPEVLPVSGAIYSIRSGRLDQPAHL
ncbi:MAG: DNA replication/repair protein RecF [Parachlamydiales bacterium]